ncbi:hypothetical protein [Methylocystis sp.]|uniref:hypothetical protein n=1 Tax=Methylocystis sp. TaxID=1911079 RepID=UPI003DA430EE
MFVRWDHKRRNRRDGDDPPRDGSIVLAHPNGNEPGGLRLLSRLIKMGRLPGPLRPINDAP